MIKNNKNLIIFITILNCAQLIQSDELVELNCLNKTQCKQFQNFGIKSLCVEGQCQCTTGTGDSVKCQPMNPKMNNVIGGACPCQQPNAECDKQQDICYCSSDYMPSSDKRRCIPKMVALGEKCELDSQCQKVDFNANCHQFKECMCMDQFVNKDGKCASIVGIKSFCTNDTVCLKQYGAHTECSNTTHYCVCMPDHFTSIDNSKCLKISKYLENCVETQQCIGTMGPGGECVENVCQCSKKYFVEEKKTEGGAIETVCTAVVERGQYCRFAEDCYQRQLNESEQSMDCAYGECNCKKGFYSYNEGECIQGSEAASKSLINQSFMIGVAVIVNIYF